MKTKDSLSRATLQDLCVQVTDGTHDSPELKEDGIPFIKGKHISSGFVDFANCDFISYEDHLKVISRSKPEKDDILLSNIGSIGDCAYVNSNVEFSIKNVALIKPDARKIDSRYLFYQISSPKFQERISSSRSGAAQPFISLGLLRNFVIDYEVHLPTQRKIAAVLSAYDDLIENNVRRIAILEEMAAALYREWFIELRFPGHASVPVAESEQGRVPQGWEIKTLGDLATDERRAANPTQVDADTPYIGLEHIPRKSIALSEWGRAQDVSSAKLFFNRGEILFGKIRPYFHKVAVAPVSGVCSTDAIVIVPRAAESFALVLCCASSEEFVAHAVQTSQGTKMPRANWGVMSRFPVVVPPVPLMQRFNAAVNEMVEQIQKLTAVNANLRATRDLLLPKLVAGEVDVSQLAIAGADLTGDADETASDAEDAEL